MELWSSLLNHHLHRRHESTFADPAGCSSYGARHATCKDKAPRERSTQRTPSRNLTLGGKPAVPAVSKFEPGQGIPPFSLSSASTRLAFQLNLGGCFLTSLPFQSAYTTTYLKVYLIHDYKQTFTTGLRTEKILLVRRKILPVLPKDMDFSHEKNLFTS